MKNLIWSSEVNFEEWDREDYEDWCEMNDVEPTSEGFEEWVHDNNNIYLEDERDNLNVEVGCVIGVCTMNTWNGSRNTAYILGSNLHDIFEDAARFSSIEDATWYAEDGEVRGELKHHDGTHHVIYRKCESEEEASDLLERVSTTEEILARTKSLWGDVADVYGWA